MAAVIEQSLAGNTGVTTPASYSVTLPTGTSVGRQLVIIVSSGATVNTPAGFTLDKSQVNNNGHYVFRKATAAGETSWTVTPTASAAGSWWAAEISGLTSTPLDVSVSAGTGSQITSHSTGTTSATTQAAAIAIGSVGTNRSATGSVAFSGWTEGFTEIGDTCSTNGGTDNIGLGVATKALSATGTQETTATLSASAAATGIMVVYKETTGTAHTRTIQSLASTHTG